jgi:hypothetical protein
VGVPQQRYEIFGLIAPLKLSTSLKSMMCCIPSYPFLSKGCNYMNAFLSLPTALLISSV